jgi:hypothetical protein
LNFSVNKKQLEDFLDRMGEKYRENFCLGVAHSRQIQRLFCVDFNKNKYEWALTQSTAKKLGTSQFGVQLIFGNGLSWYS